MRFDDVIYRGIDDEDADEGRLAERQRSAEDMYKADGTSLEPGSGAYRKMVMDDHGLTEDERDDVDRDVADWQHAVAERDPHEQFEDELEYRENIAEGKAALVEQPPYDGSFVRDNVKREQMLRLSKQMAVAAAREDLLATAAEGYGTEDSEVAEAAIDAIERGAADARSVEVIHDMAEDAIDLVEDTSEDELAEDRVAGYEMEM